MKRYLVIGVVVLCAVILASCGRMGKPKKNVLLITLDTVRADRIGCYGYEKAKTPNIDMLASQGAPYMNAYCQVPITLPSHASILTGLNPPRHGIHLNGPYVLPESVETIATVLKEEGYDTAAFVSAYVLDSQFGLARGFDVYDDNFFGAENITNPERPAGATTEKALEWLNAERKKPFFMWVHYFDPHRPYDPPEPYRTEFKDNPYDGEIAYTDEMVGKIMKALAVKGLDKSTIVVLVSDHGEGLGDHDELTHSFYAYDTTLKIPLIIRTPEDLADSEGMHDGIKNRHHVLAETVDIMPMVLSKLGIKRKVKYDGYDLPNVRLSDRHCYAETWYPLSFGWSSLLTARKGDWKYISAPKPELYNTREDPGELNNVYDANPEIAKEMHAWLDTYLKTAKPPAANEGIADPEKMKKLQSLGYAGSSAKSIEAMRKLDLPDPKDRLQVFKTINKARDLMREGESDKALEMLMPLAKEEEKNPIFLQVLGGAYVNKRDYENGIKYLKRFYELDPHNLESSAVLGAALLENGNPGEAIKILSGCVDVMPGYARAWNQLGICYGMTGDRQKSISAGGKAVELEPLNPIFKKNLGVSLMNANLLAEAEKMFRSALEAAGGEDIDMLYHVGLSLNRQNKYRQSVIILEKARELNVAHRPVKERLLEAYYNSGKKDEAGKLADELAKEGKTGPVASYYMGKIMLESGKHAEAVPHLETAVKGMPRFPPAYIVLAQALSKIEGHKENAAALLKLAEENKVTLPSDLIDQLKK